MEALQIIQQEIVAFFRANRILKFLKEDDYSWILTFEGIIAILAITLSFVYLFEIFSALFTGKFRQKDFIPQLLAYFLNRAIDTLIFLGTGVFWMKIFSKYQFYEVPFSWYWVIYGLFAWDFGVWVCHWASHKVRLLWLVHAPHHTSETMNLGVATGNFFLENAYLNLFRVMFAMLIFGLTPKILFFVVAINGLWVRFSHISETALRNGRLGILNYILITPSLHRVHHARNLKYLDMNYSNVVTFWDWIFGTYKTEDSEEKVEYGITRPVRVGNFFDYYFGEWVALWRDVVAAPTLKDKLFYLIMPPGWSHTGDHKMTHVLRKKSGDV